MQIIDIEKDHINHMIRIVESQSIINDCIGKILNIINNDAQFLKTKDSLEELSNNLEELDEELNIFWEFDDDEWKNFTEMVQYNFKNIHEVYEEYGSILYSYTDSDYFIYSEHNDGGDIFNEKLENLQFTIYN
ncbi:MAG: hypothetical protein CTY19_05755 [Methylomonas sp.]|nr:MAG: hypothetical protein CTY19_05755 [Methylomonas sp.]